MVETKYAYSIAGDTANAKVSDTLQIEIGASAIVTAVSYLTSSADVLDIYMKDALSVGDEAILDAVVLAHEGVELEPSNQKVDVDQSPPFASKKILVNGVTKSLFKRVHGVSETIVAGATTSIDFVVPYLAAKFTGANIFGSDLGDTLDFKVMDNATNDYSGAPTSPLPDYYPNYQLNQFGFDVEMPNGAIPNGGVYENTSNYDADLYPGMIIRCEYTNNGATDKKIAMNVWLHEVK